MKSKKFSIMLGVIFCALVAQAQDASSDADWDSDPLDVIEPQKEKAEPGLPEFEEIPEPGAQAEPPPPVLQPSPPPPAIEVQPSAVAAQPSASPSEPPDYSKESRFHRIYKDFNEQPTSVESWEKAVGARQSETYEVQKGDTLSGISTTLFGDQFFWPKIWSLNNSKIFNPHEIAPGMAVQFFPGSADDAPTLQLGEEATEGATEEVAVTVEAPAAEVAAATEGAAPAESAVEAPVKSATVKLPPPKKTSPLLRTLPGSLPAHAIQISQSPAVDVQIEMPQSSFPAPLEYLEYYIADAPVQGAGVITGAEMDMKSAGEYQYVFVRLDGASGKQFVAQKNMTVVADPQNKKRQGHMVEVQGEVEILEKVNPEKNIYRAMVKKAIEPVEVGAVLTPGKLPMISAAGGNMASGVGAKIMGGQFDKKRNLFGSNSLVFLDSGTGQGLQEGQTLSIYADERVRNKKTDALENDRVIGLVKVVRVTPGFATAYVVKATEDIRVGDYVGKAGAQARAASPEAAAEPEFEDVPETTGGASGGTENFDEEFDEAAPADEAAPDSGSEDSDLEL